MNSETESKIENIAKSIFLKNGDAQLKSEIDQLMLNAMKHSGMRFIKRKFTWWYLSSVIKRNLAKGKSLQDIESALRKITAKQIDKDKVIYPKAVERAQEIAEKLNKDIVGKSILDLGAGNGLLAQVLKESFGYDVTLLDVIDYNLSNLPLKLITEGEKLPLPDKSVDTTIIYLVLHHSDAPFYYLREAVRVTRKRILLMEGYIDEPDIHQRNCFLDWFFNRIIQNADINIPLNFQTIDQWKEAFDELRLTIDQLDVVGIDEPKAPEYHVYFSLEVNPSAVNS